jgi:high affinity Mn2+ porin
LLGKVGRSAYRLSQGRRPWHPDGQLPYPGTEQIMETYYSFPLGAVRATADYQFIVNPGYNRDRGPVSVIAMRLHAQF